MSCNHKFVDSNHCGKCGLHVHQIAALELGEASREVYEQTRAIQQQKLELAKLRDAFDDAVALLRDWEDYDPADPECGWQKRRDEFLAEHEEAGR
jgi:hypothetical protein